MSEEIVQEAIENLSFLMEENDVSKRCKEKAGRVIQILNSNTDLFIHKALIELEDLTNTDISSYHRTHVWGIISILESAKN